MKTNLDDFNENNSFNECLLEIIESLVKKYKFALEIRGIARIEYWAEHMDKFVQLYQMLGDKESKRTFLRLLQFELGTALAGNFINDELSLYPPLVWNDLCQKAYQISHVDNDYILDRVETFILEGYNYNEICCASDGDVVFDCGTFTGNTVKYFSERVGEKGSVYAFEPMPDNFRILKENMEKIAASNVVVENYAISDSTKDLFFSNENSPASCATDDKNGIKVRATSIDDYCRSNSISKVDFIKMDIEGSEMDALNGCEWTCKKFHPKLAICIYHKNSDFIDIPQKIIEMNPNYQFYIKHNSNTLIETVLFALPTKENKVVTVEEKDVKFSRMLFGVLISLYNKKQAYIDKRNVDIHERLLRAYIDKLYSICDIHFDVKYDQKFSYVYMPLTDDDRLHYEFCFDRDRIKVALHFEGKWVSKGDIIDKGPLQKLSTILLENNRSYIYEYYYLINQDNVELTANLMKYLIKKTYPNLLDNGLVSDIIRFRNNVSLIS